MSDTTDEDRTRIDVCLRAAGPEAWNHQQRIIDRLEQMKERGLIDRYRVQTWGKVAAVAGAVSETKFHSAAVGIVREFEEWADAHDEEVDLPFHRDEVVSEFTGERHPVIRLPVVCLGVYEDEELVGVYPRTEAKASHSVRDALARAAEAEGEASDLLADLESATNPG